MALWRSEKAKEELASKSRALNLRERGALFLANGERTRLEVQELLQDDGSILNKLIDAGYLIADDPATRQQALSEEFQNTDPAAVLPVRGVVPAEHAAPAKSADNFDGKRSLATTRMFLFDICERMFVRKMPEMANHYRDQLREARDRESMIAIARDIILNVEELAGSERADGLRERIAMLLPPEQ